MELGGLSKINNPTRHDSDGETQLSHHHGSQNIKEINKQKEKIVKEKLQKMGTESACC